MNYSEKLTAIPADIVQARDYERLSSEFISQDVAAYIEGGVGDELTLARNRSVFDAVHIIPKLLVDFSSAATNTEVLGSVLQHPFLLGPVAHQQLVHPEGERATAQAADAMGTGLVASTLSSVTMEEIATQTRSPTWFQLYWQPEKKHVLTLVRRAEAAGYTALIVTVDVPVTALRYREQRAGFSHPPELEAANLSAFAVPPPIQLSAGDSTILHGIMAQAPRWEDLLWLREQTDLPIVLKGVMSPDDAKLAKSYGFDGVIVSNHGGRSLDGVPATLEVLGAVRGAVGSAFPVLIDSGFRRGGDIFKALALGADAVLIGRLQIHALSVAGALGVAHMLRLLREELEVTMALAGCPTIGAIGLQSVRHCLNPFK